MGRGSLSPGLEVTAVLKILVLQITNQHTATENIITFFAVTYRPADLNQHGGDQS